MKAYEDVGRRVKAYEDVGTYAGTNTNKRLKNSTQTDVQLLHQAARRWKHVPGVIHVFSRPQRQRSAGRLFRSLDDGN